MNKNKALFEVAAQERVREVKKHFKKNSGDLDWNFIKEDIFYDAMGFHLCDFILQELLNQRINVSLQLDGGQFVLRKQKGKLPKGKLKFTYVLLKKKKSSKRGKKRA